MKRLLAFEVLTVPDVEGIRRLHRLPEQLGDYEVAEYALQRARVSSGHDRVPPYLQQVAAIGYAGYSEGTFSQGVVAAEGATEAILIQSLFDLVGANSALCSWRGSREGIPVLTARAMVLGVAMELGAFALHRDLAEELVLGAETTLGEFASVADVSGAAEPTPQELWLECQRGQHARLNAMASSRAAAVLKLGLRLAATRGEISQAAKTLG